jgi:cytochrome P450
VPIAARRVVEDLFLEEGPYFLPKGSSVMINIQAVHLDPEIWPEPMKFDPARFLPDDDNDDTPDINGSSNTKTASKQNKPIQPFTFLPFIAGPRNCLGQHLALLESKMVIVLLTQRYDFALPGSDGIDPEEWSNGSDPRHRFMVPVIPKEELMVTVTRK